jgi:uncharacterized surface protein with fasciclin (FAS1) repeats
MMRFLVAGAILMYGVNADVTVRKSEPSKRDLRVHGELRTLDELIMGESDLSTLSTALETAMLSGVLCTTPGCNFTIFAPTNDAFLDFNQTFLTMLLTPSWILHLQNLLAFHVTFPTLSGDRLLTTNFTDGQNLDMLNNEVVTVNLLQSGITLTSPLTEGSDIVEADILASNGVLDKIDTVLSPGYFGVDVFALGDEYVEFTILQELIEVIGLAGTEGEFTVLAPTNDAFLALGNETLEALKKDKDALGAILANHVIVGVYPSTFLTDGLVLEALSGLQITVSITNSTDVPGATVLMFNDATVIFADILAQNGIAHAIDSVILQTEPESHTPSMLVSNVPTTFSSEVPSAMTSSIPSEESSSVPSQVPSDVLSVPPSGLLSYAPSRAPSQVPSDVPSAFPSDAPTDSPSSAPSGTPSAAPSESPSSKKGMMKRGN